MIEITLKSFIFSTSIAKNLHVHADPNNYPHDVTNSVTGIIDDHNNFKNIDVTHDAKIIPFIISTIILTPNATYNKLSQNMSE